MALQARPKPARPVSLPQPQVDVTHPQSPLKRRTIADSQEWILFSPQPDTQTASRTSETPRTATYVSDFGSLETHIRSQPRGSQEDDDNLTCHGTEDEDGAELDSLDDGLHAFHHPFSASSHQLDHSGGAVLPTHDGFGTFPGSSAALQEHLWQFERHNPRRRTSHARRRSSVQRRLDASEEEEHLDPDHDRTARIEKWRLDQSRAVLEEIERETRRRRRRMSRMSATTGGVDRKQSVHDSLASRVLTRSSSAIPEEPESLQDDDEQPPSESFWRRITRKVIQDLIGLDETTLSVIFGEQLVDEGSPTPTQTSPIAQAASVESRVAFNDSEPSWEVKLLDRIARELGVLVNRLAEFDGSAFSTYKQIQQQPIEYAGLPRDIPRQPSLRQRRREEQARAHDARPKTMFSPTVPPTLLQQNEQADTSLWGIEEESEQPAAAELQQEREYWEKDVDVKMIFSYLKSRFSKGTEEEPALETTAVGPLPASWVTAGPSASAMSTSPEGLRRAEIIKQQHPLVSRAADRAARAAQSRRSDILLRRRQMQSLVQKRPGSSSCASQSTKRSRHSRSGSSRHYWDLGGSVESVGSGHAGSALGGWGEV